MPAALNDEEAQKLSPVPIQHEDLNAQPRTSSKNASDLTVPGWPTSRSIKEPFSRNPLLKGTSIANPRAQYAHQPHAPRMDVGPRHRQGGSKVDPAMERLRRFAALLILAFGLLLIIGPLWLLNMLSTEKAKLTAISILVASFVGLLGLGTGAEPFETLAAAAA